MEPLSNLTPEKLRKLYIEDGLTETAIAALYGTYQVRVNRLRSEYGIETILKSDRLDLPEFTLRQKSLIIGSMLGDGGLQTVGASTARYTEHHCLEQKSYLDWKVTELEPFVSCVTPSDKGPHKGYRLVTHTTSSFYPYWGKFYPPGTTDKVFWNLDAAEVDAFALAVWFMDDGSRVKTGVRFSVGPDKRSQQRQMEILENFGLRANLYTTSDPEIQITNHPSLLKFVELVGPHMHDILRYKLDFKWPMNGRMTVPKPSGSCKGLLTEALLRELALTMTDVEIGRRYGMTGEGIAYHRKKHHIPRRPI